MLRTPITFARPERLAALALVIVGLIAYSNCLASEFIFDDLLFINGRSLDFHSLAWLASPIDLPIKGRPLAGLSFVVNYAICGTQPTGYHLFNLTVHVACTIALFGTVRRAMLRWDSGISNTNATGFAFACAALWMIHPLQTECVNYVSQRTESMAALFTLASLYCAIRSYESLHRSRWIVAAGAASWAAVLCKENAAVGPLLVVLFDFTYEPRPIWNLVRDRWRVYAATFSSWIPLASLLLLFPRTVTVGMGGGAAIVQYGLNQSILIVHYLRLVFWPDALVIDYGRPSEVTWFDAFPCVAAVLAMFGLALAVYRRHPAIGCLALAGFVLLAPTSSFLPINSEVGAERRMYLPLAAIVVLVSLGVREAVRRCCAWSERRGEYVGRNKSSQFRPEPNVTSLPELRKALFRPTGKRERVIHGALLSATVLVLGVRTFERNADYADPFKLWTQAVAAHPENPRAWSWLVLEYSRVDPSAAQRLSAEMARRWRDDWRVQFDVGETYLGLHHNAAAASQCYRRVVALDPLHARAQLRLVWLLAGCVEDELRDGNEALRIAQHLQARFPDSPETLDALAIAQAECGDFAAAIANAEAAIANAESMGGSTAAVRQRAERYRQRLPFRFNET